MKPGDKVMARSIDDFNEHAGVEFGEVYTLLEFLDMENLWTVRELSNALFATHELIEEDTYKSKLWKVLA